jgi:hypothetical protein
VEAIDVSVIKATPEISNEPIYQREHRPNNLLRWDVTVEPQTIGEKALAINYEFKMVLDRHMSISSFQTRGVANTVSPPANTTPVSALPALPAMSDSDKAVIKAEMAKLPPEDRRLAEAQVFCAIDQGSPLGSTGPIYKVVIKDKPVFLCCKGCVAEAKAHPDETLVQFQQLMARLAKK